MVSIMGSVVGNKTNDEFYSIEVEKTTFRVLRRYQNIVPIGRGSQGLVCAAEDVLTKKQVAIKRMSCMFNEAMFAKRTYRELMIMQNVNHKNVMSLENVFTPQKSLLDFSEIYLVMERMDNDMSAVPRLDHDQLSSLIYQLLCGMKHLHSAGIIHRDLKPTNIGVIGSDCSLKILDFGLARLAANSKNKLTQYVITRPYRAPEVILCMEYNEQADVWSMGCIFGEIVRGEMVFPSTDEIALWGILVERLGTPSEEFIQRLLPDVRRFVERVAPTPPKPFDELFPDDCFPVGLEQTLQARDLLSKMLIIDPEVRISVESALSHPYLARWYDDSEVNCPPATGYDPLIEQMDRSPQEWKEAIYNEVIQFEKRQSQNTPLFGQQTAIGDHVVPANSTSAAPGQRVISA